jgi:hypothetical protein
MSGGDGKPRSPPGKPSPTSETKVPGSVKPAAPGSVMRPAATRPVPPRGTSDSAFDLPTIGGKSSFTSLPRVPSVTSMPAAKNPFADDERTAGASHSDLKRVTTASAQNLPKVSGGPTPALTSMPRRKSNVIQKQLNASAFDSEERTQMEVVLGRTKSVELDLDEEKNAGPQFYDGEVAAKEVSTKSTWRALKAPVKSSTKRRSARVLWTLLDQFAVGTNPRYVVQNPAAEHRAHVFAWDVSMAMECEIPHYKNGREMTLAQTIDWLRLESIHKFGWKKFLDPGEAIDAADRGELVFVVPQDVKLRQLAIVRPGGGGDDGLPRVASAGRPKGNDLGVVEAVHAQFVFFSHP